MKTFHSNSPEETLTFAGRLSRSLKPGDILCLFGSLGSGKTTFVQGLAKGLKIKKGQVNSPTFVIMQIYDGKLPVYHFDFYRLDDPRQISGIGYDEFLYGQGVAVIEWPERMGPLLPSEHLAVHLTSQGETLRDLKISARGRRYKELIKVLV